MDECVVVDLYRKSLTVVHSAESTTTSMEVQQFRLKRKEERPDSEKSWTSITRMCQRVSALSAIDRYLEDFAVENNKED